MGRGGAWPGHSQVKAQRRAGMLACGGHRSGVRGQREAGGEPLPWGCWLHRAAGPLHGLTHPSALTSSPPPPQLPPLQAAQASPRSLPAVPGTGLSQGRPQPPRQVRLRPVSPQGPHRRKAFPGHPSNRSLFSPYFFIFSLAPPEGQAATLRFVPAWNSACPRPQGARPATGSWIKGLGRLPRRRRLRRRRRRQGRTREGPRGPGGPHRWAARAGVILGFLAHGPALLLCN